MIESFNGILKSVKGFKIRLDVNGIGFGINITKRLLETIPEIDNNFYLITYLDVKEDALDLYGFYDEKEKEIFKLLKSVSGISSKTAHSILTHATFEDIIKLITSPGELTNIKIPGIGPKKLELITLTLKDKIFKISSHIEKDKFNKTDSLMMTNEQNRLEALTALVTLGYNRNEAERLIREVLKNTADINISTEELIKKSLEIIS
jgi:holliday junction DNA helicase RuvA